MNTLNFLSAARRKGFLPWMCAALPMLLAGSLHAQPLSLPWFTLDGGGGISEGGPFSLAGTIGQSDAAPPASGGSFTLQGGVWGVIRLIQTPGAPRLSIGNLPDGNLRVFWPRTFHNFILESTPRLDLPVDNVWTPLATPYPSDETHVYVIVSPLEEAVYFRLRSP